MLMAEFGEMAEIILGKQISDSAPHIPEKPLGDFRVVHNATREHRQEVQRVVTSPPLKFVAENLPSSSGRQLRNCQSTKC